MCLACPGWSGGYSCSLREVVHGGLVGAGGFAQRRWVRFGEFGKSAAEHPVMGASEKHRVAQSGASDLAAVGARDAFR